MKLLTMSMSMVSTGTKNPCCLLCEIFVEWLAVPYTVLIFQKGFHEKRAKMFYILSLFPYKGNIAKYVKIPKHSLMTKSIPPVNLYSTSFGHNSYIEVEFCLLHMKHMSYD